MKIYFSLFKIALLYFCLTSYDLYGRFIFKNEKQNYATLPIEIINNIIVIKLQINDSDTLRFLFDTGVKTTIITELFTENKLNLEYKGYVNILGLGGDDTIQAHFSPNNRISLPYIEGYYKNILSVVGYHVALSPNLGIKVNGLIGYDLLKDFIIKIDYNNQKLIFYKHEYFYKRKRLYKNWNDQDLILENYKPYLTATIKQDSTPIDVKLLLDIGAGHNLALYPFSNKQIVLPEKKIYAFLGLGIVGDIAGYVGRIKSLQLGPYKLNQVITDFPDQESVFNTLSVYKRSGSIGGGITKRFKIILDYRNKKMYFKKNAHFKARFTYSYSGITLKRQVNIPYWYYIGYVIKNSPAHDIGLLKNDFILKINNIYAFELSFGEIYKILERKHKKIRFTIFRQGKIIQKTFMLKLYTL